MNSEKRYREKKREEKGGNHGRGWLDVLTGELQKGRAWSTGARGRDAGGGAWCSDFRGSRERDFALETDRRLADDGDGWIRRGWDSGEKRRGRERIKALDPRRRTRGLASFLSLTKRDRER